MSTKIAIVGMAGRFPAARSVDAYWRMLAEEREATEWPSDEQLLRAGVRAADLEDPAYVRATLRLPDMECFDAAFFNMSPKEAAMMDPQHRHFIETCWHALEDAGWTPTEFPGAIGVFGGCGMQAYMALNLMRNRALMDNSGMFLVRHTGNDKDFLTTRVSYLLGLTGPSVGVQTACSTSLVAVHMACQSLLANECDMALAGGVSIELPHGQGYRYAQNEILSHDGHCRAFDDAATGTIFGSGAGVVVLRRLEDALADGDDIRCVIVGTAINNDGSCKAGYLAPSVDGQAKAAAEALGIAGLDGSAVDYIEAHGTGTAIGDPIELTALSAAYGDARPGAIGIGSVKTNIGHLDTAAGVAGLIKVVLGLQRGVIPRSLNFERPNSRFDLAQSPFRVVKTSEPWPRRERPRCAAVNSLGVGGTNAHVIVEEAPEIVRATPATTPQLFTLSAKSDAALQRLKRSWLDYARRPAAPAHFSDAAFVSREGRVAHRHRETIVASDFGQLAQALSTQRVPSASADVAVENAGVVFMFPGGGAQYPGAARGLYEGNAAFRSACEECFAALSAGDGARLAELMFMSSHDDPSALTALRKPSNSVLAVFVIEYALAAMWKAWGVVPTAVIGHSAGDYAAAVVAGVMRLHDAVACLVLRGKIFEGLPQGGMLALSLDEAGARELAGEKLEIAVVNGAQATVVAGALDDIAALETRLVGQEIDVHRVPIEVAAHSHAIEPFLGEYRALLSSLQLAPPRIPMICNLRGDWLSDEDAVSPDHWCRHLRETVRFAAGLAKILERPERILVEVGPGQVLTSLARQAEPPPLAVIPSIRHVTESGCDLSFALQACGRAWTHGATVDLRALREARAYRRVSIPTYPFEAERHWIDPDPDHRDQVSSAVGAKPAPLVRIDDHTKWFSSLEWREIETLPPSSGTPRNCLVIHDGEPLGPAIVDGLRNIGWNAQAARAAEASSGLQCGGATLDPANEQHMLALIEQFARQPAGIDKIIVALDAKPADVSARAMAAFAPIFNLMKALQLADWSRPLDVLVVTNGACSLAGAPARSPEQAVVLGPCRVVARENPFVVAGVLDVSTAYDDLHEIARAVIQEASGPRTRDLTAWRAGRRYGRVSVALGSLDSLAPRLKAGGTYLITGASGGLGGLLARYLAERYQARLALVSRISTPARRDWAGRLATDTPQSRYVDSLLALEAAGAEVLPLTADVTRADQLSAAVEAARAKLGRIDGVFHLAGVLDDAPMAAKSLDGAAAVIKPKVDGALLLDGLLPPGSLDVFAVFSSVSALVGPPGQADYAAANAALDAIAARRPDGIAINWGIWSDVGMAARITRATSLKTRGSANPLLGERSERGRGSCEFTTVLDPAACWVLDEHRIGSHCVLPGMAYLDIARAAVEAIEGTQHIDIRNANFLEPLIVPDGATREVSTRVESLGARHYRIVVESRCDANSALTTHFEAEVRKAGKPGACGRDGDVDWRDRNTRLMRSAERLTVTQQSGIAFGPRFRALTSVEKDHAWSGGRVELPQSFGGDLDTYKAHPALLDTAATIGLTGLPRAGGEAGFYAPLSVAEIRRLGPLPKSFRAVSRRVSGTAGGIVTFDVAFLGERGDVIMLFKGLALKSLDAAAFERSCLAAPLSELDELRRAGLRSRDAAALFEKALNAPGHQVVVSSVSVPALLARYTRVSSGVIDAKAAPQLGEGQSPVQFANPVEERIARMCGELLGRKVIRPDEDFFALGGHSLIAVRLLAKIRKEWQVDLPLAAIFQSPTIALLAALVIREGQLSQTQPEAAPAQDQSRLADAQGVSHRPSRSEPWSPLVRINAGVPGRVPVYCIHGAGGNVLSAKPLADALGADRPFFGLQAHGVDGKHRPLESIAEMALSYLAAIEGHDGKAPKVLIGYSGGGVIAYEMLQLLAERGLHADLTVFIDTLAPSTTPSRSTLMDWVRFAHDQGLGRIPRQLGDSLRHRFAAAGRTPRQSETDDLIVERSRQIFEAYMRAQSRYRPQSLQTDILLFRASRAAVKFHRAGPMLGWNQLIQGQIEVHDVDADHDTIVAPPSVYSIADVIGEKLAAIEKPVAAAKAMSLAE